MATDGKKPETLTVNGCQLALISIKQYLR